MTVGVVNPYLHIMGNIAAFAVLVIILLCFPGVPSYAESDYAVSFSPQFGFVYGHAEEIVYTSGNSLNPILSQLLWNMKPVFYYGFLMDFSLVQQREKWGFFTDFSLKRGIPGTSGIHENRDWMSVENSDVTHFSRHSNHTQELLLLDLFAGCSIPYKRDFIFKTYLGLSFMRFSFFGMNGEGRYAYERGGSGSGIYDMTPHKIKAS